MRRTTCRSCGKILEQKARGRPRKYCSDVCKMAHFRKEEQYYGNNAQFEYYWTRLLRTERIEKFAPETLDIIKHIMKYNGDYVAGLAVKAIRTEIKARELARPKRKKQLPEIVDTTITYPDDSLPTHKTDDPKKL
jgi:hypothetical protein